MTAPALPLLLERQNELDTLAARWRVLCSPGSPPGCVLVLQAQAGGGKTSLLRVFAAQTDTTAWWSGFQPLLAPPALALLQGLSAAAPRAGAPGAEWLAAWLKLLRERPQPLLWLVDDLQWADSASLELLRYLARRIHSLRLMLVLALRSDEPSAGHPLHTLLGALPAAHTTRWVLPPLSVRAVAVLAERAGLATDAQAVHRATGGNPFFVTEALAAQGRGDSAVPASVREQVLLRVARLGTHARALLALVAAAGSGLDYTLLGELLGEQACSAAAAVDACVDAGLVVLQGDQLQMRHDLLRQAVLSAVTAEQCAQIHLHLYDCCQRRGESAARCVQHAHRAGLTDVVWQLAPQACRDALAAGAPREAADLIELLRPQLQDPTHASPAAEHAARWVLQAQAQAQAQRLHSAVQSWQEALALHRALGDLAAAGRDCFEAARLSWLIGALAAGLAQARAAVQLLDGHGTEGERAWAYATLAQLHMFDSQSRQAAQWAARALALFEAQGDVAGTVHALNTLGFADLALADRPEHWQRIERARALARQHRLHEPLARTCVNVGSLALLHRRLGEVAQACEEGLTLAREHDLDVHTTMLLLRQGWGLVQQGHAVAGGRRLAQVLQMPGLRAIERGQAQLLLALLALREGGRGAQRDWQQVLQEQQPSQVDPWYAPRGPLLAEAAWLLGDDAQALQAVQQAWPAALAAGEAWRIGALSVWCQRCGGGPGATLVELPRPWALELAGDAVGSAAAWSALGCPYEAALALAQGSSDSVRRTAYLQLDQLGAAGSLLALRRRQACAAAGLPKGRQSRTRQDPLGLTGRERAVLDALAQGLSNRAIAQRLQRSERTVEHHVAALLAKLGVHSRADAVAQATRVR
jgi:DNA-binding CsgD family transcriptional regulator